MDIAPDTETNASTASALATSHPRQDVEDLLRSLLRKGRNAGLHIEIDWMQRADADW